MKLNALSFGLACLLTVASAQVMAEDIWISDNQGCKALKKMAFSGSVTIVWRGNCPGGFVNGKGILKWFENGKLSVQQEGDFIDGRLKGRGTQDWANGDHYEGDFLDGLPAGDGVFTWGNGDRYEGEFANGSRQGRGIIRYANGSHYEGEFIDGTPAGKGTFTWANGVHYEGNFGEMMSFVSSRGEANDTWIADSQGCKVLKRISFLGPATISWRGKCEDGYASGRGVLTWYENGKLAAQQAGDFTAGKQNGNGTLELANGDRYEGNFADGVPTQNGSYIWLNGDRYDGNFVDGVRQGKGTLKYASGDRYDGEFSDGVLSGKGIFLWKNGDRFEGEFTDNRFANGIKYNVAGAMLAAFVNGKFVRASSAENEKATPLQMTESTQSTAGDRPALARAAANENWIADPHGCKVLDLHPTPHESIKWSGKCQGGYAEGHGVLEWFFNGKLNGRAEGLFIRGKQSGPGSFTYPDGNHYDGEFADGSMSGRGTLNFANGDRYTGNFSKGMKDGMGVLTLANGDHLEGYFKDNSIVSAVKYDRNGAVLATYVNGQNFKVNDNMGNRLAGQIPASTSATTMPTQSMTAIVTARNTTAAEATPASGSVTAMVAPMSGTTVTDAGPLVSSGITDLDLDINDGMPDPVASGTKPVSIDKKSSPVDIGPVENKRKPARESSKHPAEPKSKPLPSEHWWLADSHGCKVMSPHAPAGASANWTGPCRDGYAEGNGVLELIENGKLESRAIGDFVHGKQMGKGTFSYASGDHLEGNFKDGALVDGVKYNKKNAIVAVYVNGRERLQQPDPSGKEN